MGNAPKSFEVNEENFHAAVNHAPHWARKRLLKKMTKQKQRPHLVSTSSADRSPRDLEQYVANFVFTYGGKLEKV